MIVINIYNNTYILINVSKCRPGFLVVGFANDFFSLVVKITKNKPVIHIFFSNPKSAKKTRATTYKVKIW